MGTNNRARRAAKKAKRSRTRRSSAGQGAQRAASAGGFAFGSGRPSSGPHGPGCTCNMPDGSFGFDDLGETGAPPTEETIETVFGGVVEACAAGDEPLATQLLASLEVFVPARQIDTWVELRLMVLLRHAWEAGWQPLDVVEHTRRSLDQRAVTLVTDVIASEAAQYAPATVDDRWSEQLADIGARSWWRDDLTVLAAWASKHATGRVAAWLAVAAVIGLLERLPRLERTLPLPGSASARPAARARGEVSEKVLGRVRSLLAKAEATDFPDEAEALSGKAQQLMTKFSLDRALLDAGPGDDDGVGERRIWLDKPYVSAKAMLVTASADANRCRAILFEKLGFVSVVGDETDLRFVEVLATSLLVQANRAMLARGSQRTVLGRSSTRSYRQSFLVSYATRIGERLSEGAAAGQAEIDDERLLPVLAARDARVEERFSELYPHTKATSISISNAAGWHDGRVAADMAELGTRHQVE